MRFLIEILTLATSRARVSFALIAHLMLLVIPYAWLTNLSLYKLIGLDWVPSIGLTRAYWLLLHGDLAGAWERNWLIFPVIAVGWSIIVVDIYRLYTHYVQAREVNSVTKANMA